MKKVFGLLSLGALVLLTGCHGINDGLSFVLSSSDPTLASYTAGQDFFIQVDNNGSTNITSIMPVSQEASELQIDPSYSSFQSCSNVDAYNPLQPGYGCLIAVHAVGADGGQQYPVSQANVSVEVQDENYATEGQQIGFNDSYFISNAQLTQSQYTPNLQMTLTGSNITAADQDHFTVTTASSGGFSLTGRACYTGYCHFTFSAASTPLSGRVTISSNFMPVISATISSSPTPSFYALQKVHANQLALQKVSKSIQLTTQQNAMLDLNAALAANQAKLISFDNDEYVALSQPDNKTTTVYKFDSKTQAWATLSTVATSDVASLLTQGHDLLLAGDQHLWQSDNNGETWQQNATCADAQLVAGLGQAYALCADGRLLQYNQGAWQAFDQNNYQAVAGTAKQLLLLTSKNNQTTMSLKTDKGSEAISNPFAKDASVQVYGSDSTLFAKVTSKTTSWYQLINNSWQAINLPKSAGEVFVTTHGLVTLVGNQLNWYNGQAWKAVGSVPADQVVTVQ